MQTQPNTWLCIAYAFPPINRSGTHRTSAFVRHLETMGWDAEVLTVDPSGEAVDPALLQHIPRHMPVHRTRWVDLVAVAKHPFNHLGPRPNRVSPRANTETRETRWSLRSWCSRLLQTPDSRLGWVPFGVSAGIQCIRRSQPDILYSTSPYASAHLIAWILHRIFRIPWVADFRDPWVSNPYAAKSHPSLHRWNEALERLVIRTASKVVCNTATLRDSLCERYPSEQAKCVTIANGVDSDLFPEASPMRGASTDRLELLHAGQFYGPRRPHLLFEALRSARESLAHCGVRPHLTLLGSEVYDGTPLRTLVERAGVGDAVSILGQRTHADTLALLRGADALVLVGSNGQGAELQVPNKLYEYMGARRPILSVMPADSPALRMLADGKAEVIVCDPLNARSIADGIGRLALNNYDRPLNPWSGVEQFNRTRRAAELCNVFNSLMGKNQENAVKSATATTAHVGHRDSFAARDRSSSPARAPKEPASHPAES